MYPRPRLAVGGNAGRYRSAVNEVQPADLVVHFDDEDHRVDPDRQLVFGRGAELDIDSNRFLHRAVGAFVHRNGAWWLQNVGGAITLTVTCPDSRWSAEIPPGTQSALTTRTSIIRFSAGPATYELVAINEAAPEIVGIDAFAISTRTTAPPTVPLNAEQRQLLAALAEPRLREPGSSASLPTNQAVADRLGWTLRKLNRKLDWLCDRYTKSGVPGLHGGERRARDRRQILVDHVIRSGAITSADLELLPDAPTSGSPRS